MYSKPVLVHQLLELLYSFLTFTKPFDLEKSDAFAIRDSGVERHAEAAERLLDDFVVAVNHLLWCDALLTCLDGDGHAMLIATAYRYYVITLKAKVTCIYVRRHINTRQVADMDRAIGIG